MVNLERAIEIAKKGHEKFVIDEYMESENSYIFPISDPNGPNESNFFYEVVKETGEHGVFDYWGLAFEQPDFINTLMSTRKKIG